MDTRFNTERYLEGVERLSAYSTPTSNDNATGRTERHVEVTPTYFGSCSYHEAAIAEAREPRSHRFP